MLGDSRMEMGEPELAAKAYQKMIDLRPNQASYNRMAYYRWVSGRPDEAITLMNLAVGAKAELHRKTPPGAWWRWAICTLKPGSSM